MKSSDTARTMREFQQKALLLTVLSALWAPTAMAEKPKEAAEAEKMAVEASEKGKVPVDESEATEESEAMAEAAEEAIDLQKTEDQNETHQVYGWKEWIKVGTKSDRMRAKLDSGARTSSLHAEGVEEFERDGRPWVKFTLTDPRDSESKDVVIKAPIKRTARVKNTDGTVESRYVVELGFKIGSRQMREEFTLNDRSTMTCPVLIGRNALRHLGYLDCSRVDLADKEIVK